MGQKYVLGWHHFASMVLSEWSLPLGHSWLITTMSFHHGSSTLVGQHFQCELHAYTRRSTTCSGTTLPACLFQNGVFHWATRGILQRCPSTMVLPLRLVNISNVSCTRTRDGQQHVLGWHHFASMSLSEWSLPLGHSWHITTMSFHHGSSAPVGQHFQCELHAYTRRSTTCFGPHFASMSLSEWSLPLGHSWHITTMSFHHGFFHSGWSSELHAFAAISSCF